VTAKQGVRVLQSKVRTAKNRKTKKKKKKQEVRLTKDTDRGGMCAGWKWGAWGGRGGGGCTDRKSVWVNGVWGWVLFWF